MGFTTHANALHIIAQNLDNKYKVSILVNDNGEILSSMSEKAKQIVDKIVDCKDEVWAVDIIKEVIDNLRVSKNYEEWWR